MQGYSLLELLIVMAIIAILVAISYPSYQYHLLQTHRHEAQIELMNIANQLEEYHSLNNTYEGASLADFNLKPNDYYDFQLDHLAENEYQIHALPKFRQSADQCGALWLDQLGNQGAAKNACW